MKGIEDVTGVPSLLLEATRHCGSQGVVAGT